MLKSTCCIIFFLLVASQANNGQQNQTTVKCEETLVSAYLKEQAPLNYWDRPVKDASKPVKVYVKMGLTSLPIIVSPISFCFFLFLFISFFCFNSQHEQAQHLDAKGLLNVGWVDEYRSWNSTFPCIDSMIIPHGEKTGMWLPDVAIVTAESFYELTNSKLYPLRVRSNGEIDFAPGGLIRFQCKMELDKFPFDSMTCISRIESWLYNTAKQVFNKDKSDAQLLNFSDHEQWKLTSFTVSFDDVFYPISGLTYGAIDFKITLVRKANFYLVNLILPSIMLSLLECVTFILPEQQVIRIQLSVLLLLAYTMFLSVIQNDLPRSSDQTPLLTIYVTLMIIFIAMAITFQCLVMMMINKATNGSKVPGCLAILFRYDGKSKEEIDNNSNTQDIIHHHQQRTDDEKGEKLNKSIWKKMYKFLDRLAAFVYFSSVALTTVLLLIVKPMLYF